MIVYELLTLDVPFKNYNITMLCNKVILHGERPEFKFPIADCYRELITMCWSHNPDERPTFDEIVDNLKNNEEFITDSIDKDEFLDYIDQLDSIGSSFEPSKKFTKINLQPKEENENIKIVEEDSENLKSIQNDSANSNSKIDETVSTEGNNSLNEEILQPSLKVLCRFDAFDKLSKEMQDILKESINENFVKSKSITIKSNRATVICVKNLLNSEDTINVFKQFDEVSFDIEYSEDFRSVFFYFCDFKATKMDKININVIINEDMKYKDIFNSRSVLFNVIIKSSVTSIPQLFLSKITSLSKVTIPSSVKIIDKYAFNKCISLSEIIFEYPSSISQIMYCAFSKCQSLTQIILPSSLTSIGDSILSDCTSLKQISIPSSIRFIGNKAFKNCTSLKQVTFEIPSSLTVIHEEAFKGCSSLIEISIPASVVKMGAKVFKDCSSLKKVTMPSIHQSFPKKYLGLGLTTKLKLIKQENRPTIVRID